MRDGAQVLIHLVFSHANTGVGHGHGTSIFVEGHVNGQLVFTQAHIGIGQALEVELVHGIGRIGDELAQKDLAIGVDRVDHEVEQLLALCLELLHELGPSFLM